MGLAHEKKSYLQEKANLFEIGSTESALNSSNHSPQLSTLKYPIIWFFCILCKKREENSRPPCAVKSQSGIIGRVAPFYSV